MSISVLDPSSTGTAGAVGGGVAGAALGALGGTAIGALSSGKGKRRKGALSGALWGAGLGGLGGGLFGHSIGKNMGGAARDLVMNEAITDPATQGVLFSISNKMNDRKYVQSLMDNAAVKDPNPHLQKQLAHDRPGRWFGGMSPPLGGHGAEVLHNLALNKANNRYQLPIGKIPEFLKDPVAYESTNWATPFKADMLEEAQAKGPTADQVNALVQAYQGKN